METSRWWQVQNII